MTSQTMTLPVCDRLSADPPSYITFTAACSPMAQPRQRQRVVQANGSAFVSNYTPSKHPIHSFKAAIQVAFRNEYDGAPLEGPLGIALVFVLPRPADKIWKRRAMPRIHSNRKKVGDWDNIAKAFCDALNKIAWRDDSQIASAKVDIYIAAGDEQPHVEARIWMIE